MSKTVIILGAGFTRAAGERKPLEWRPPLDADFFNVAKRCKDSNIRRAYKDVSEVLESLVKEYSINVKDSLEAASTHLYMKSMDAPDGSIYQHSFLKLLDLLRLVLGYTTNWLPVGPTSTLRRFLSYELYELEKPEDLSVITFNYDLLVERILDNMGTINGHRIFQFPGCYRIDSHFLTPGITDTPEFNDTKRDHEGVALYKLHGSINWVLTHNSNTPKPSQLSNSRRRMDVLNSYEIREVTLRRTKTVYGKPIIVPPVSGKRAVMHKDISFLWTSAAEALREADRIIIAGYSCSPMDVEARMLLSENLRQNSNKKLYIINPNVESAARLIDICGGNRSTVYSSVRLWVDDGFKRRKNK